MRASTAYACVHHEILQYLSACFAGELLVHWSLMLASWQATMEVGEHLNFHKAGIQSSCANEEMPKAQAGEMQDSQ